MMTAIPPLVEGALRMAIEGASAAVGRPPAWLQRGADIRFTGYSHSATDTLLAVELPTIGEAAEELYRQRQFWDTRPSPDETAFEVLARVVGEVAAGSGDSPWYDRQLLTRFAKTRRVFSSQQLESVRLDTGNAASAATVNAAVAETAQQLSNSTPPSRPVRVAGLLDMIRHSTRSFSVRLDSGEEIRGVMQSPADSPAALQSSFGKRVLVLGNAIYRPSGRLLRIDASALEDGAEAPPLFSRIPSPQRARPALTQTAAPTGQHGGKRGVAAFFGTWPGDETDADFDFMVCELRSGH